MPMPALANHACLQRFSQLGLRWNPFRVAERSEIPQLYLPELRNSLLQAEQIVRDHSSVTQIIAARGWGKSTLLAAVERELMQAGIPYAFHYLRLEGPYAVKQPCLKTSVLLIDEAQRLSWRGRRTVSRWLRYGRRRLIVSTHDELPLPGRHTVVTLRLPQVTAARFGQLFAKRIEWAGGDAARFQIDPETAHWLIDRCGNNLRLIEMSLYEVFQSIEPAERITIDMASIESFAEKIDAFVKETRRLEALHR